MRIWTFGWAPGYYKTSAGNWEISSEQGRPEWIHYHDSRSICTCRWQGNKAAA